ncbi:hypothetical protein TSMEX_004431 [Taenia solium]|eukprot:TsM_000957500 transcript=TsM_000957500 gene=TsM_000957500
MLNCRKVVRRSSASPCPTYRRQRLRHDTFAKGDSLVLSSAHVQQFHIFAVTQANGDVVELVANDESECDLSDHLNIASQWSHIDEQAGWWHLPPSWVVSNSLASLSLTTVTSLAASQMSSTQEATGVEPDVESDGEVEDTAPAASAADMLTALQHGTREYA